MFGEAVMRNYIKTCAISIVLLNLGALNPVQATEISQSFSWSLDPVYDSPLGFLSSDNIHILDPFDASLGTLTDIRWSVEAGMGPSQFAIPVSPYPVEWSVGAGTICAVSFGGLGDYTCDTSTAVGGYFSPQFTATGSNFPGFTATYSVDVPPMDISLDLALSGLASGDTLTNALAQIGSNGAAAGVGAFAFGSAIAQIPDIIGGPQNIGVDYLPSPFEGTFTWTYVYDAAGGGAVTAPEPATLALLGAGLIGAWSTRRRRTII